MAYSLQRQTTWGLYTSADLDTQFNRRDLETVSTSTLLGKTRTLEAHVQRHEARQIRRSINTNCFSNVAVYDSGRCTWEPVALSLFLAQKLNPTQRGCSVAAAPQSLSLASSSFSLRLHE